MLEKYPVQVKLVHKFVPAHDFTWQAAIAALAAEKQGKFWEFHDQLFENQGVLNDSKIMEIAKSLHLDLGLFRASLKDPDLRQMVQRDYDDTRGLGIKSTPTVYLNGRLLLKRSLEDLDQAIGDELRR